MSETQPENIPLPQIEPRPATPQPDDAITAASPPTLKRVPPKESDDAPPRERRDFFGEAMREMLVPLSGLLERKINPFLAALEQLPEEAERLADTNFGLLDQPQSSRRELPLHPLHREPSRYLRPPGATPSSDSSTGFESICSRCGNCVAACPVHAIQLDSNGLVAEGFPYIVPDTQPCVVCDSLACMKSCPTGALKLVDRLHINMGTASVDHSLCLRDHGEACTLCIDVCPINGKSPENPMSALFISADSGKIRVRRNSCVGCGLCENRCPTEPRAITVIPRTELPEPIIA